MDLEALKSIFEGFDLAAFLPKIDSILGWIEILLRLCVMGGPLLIFGYGLLYLIMPPKEANYSVGYRFWWSMASLDAWQFTHRLVGCIWTPLGLVLAIIMAFFCNAFRRMGPIEMVWSAMRCLGWELAAVLVSCLIVNLVVIIVFDIKGFRRFGDLE